VSAAAGPTFVDGPAFVPRLRARRALGRVFELLCLAAGLLAVLVLVVLLAYIGWQGWRYLSWSFLTRFASTLNPERSGILAPLVGSLWLVVLTALFAVPTGVGAAIYLEEYSRKTRFTKFITLNITNLAGVPSIVYGILGLALFVRWILQSRSLLAGALTMSLLILPVIIIASREALLAVPRTIREAAFAVGATRWQTVRHHVLPAAVPGIMTGIILALSRAIGESAPLITLGALTFTTFYPGQWPADTPVSVGGVWQWLTEALDSQFAVLPLQIFDWSSRPQDEFRELAASGIIVLLVVLLSLNALATGIRAWQQRHRNW
jgi:phosphate transport system permease protein